MRFLLESYKTLQQESQGQLAQLKQLEEQIALMVSREVYDSLQDQSQEQIALLVVLVELVVLEILAGKL